MKQQINDIKYKILPILKRYGTRRAGLFGSCVRGELRAASDVDILVEIGGDLSLLDFVKLKHELEDTLGRHVDLVEYVTLKPLLRDRILSEEVQII
jgi:hypothetical protein